MLDTDKCQLQQYKSQRDKTQGDSSWSREDVVESCTLAIKDICWQHTCENEQSHLVTLSISYNTVKMCHFESQKLCLFVCSLWWRLTWKSYWKQQTAPQKERSALLNRERIGGTSTLNTLLQYRTVAESNKINHIFKWSTWKSVHNSK